MVIECDKICTVASQISDTVCTSPEKILNASVNVTELLEASWQKQDIHNSGVRISYLLL